MCGGNVSRAEEEDPVHAKEYKCNITSYCSTVLKIFLLFHIIIPVLLFLIHKY